MIPGLLLALALSAQSGEMLVVPDKSPFSIEEAGHEYGGPVRFKGELRFEGNYQFEWVVIDGKPEWLELRIVPNEAALKLIPFDENKPVSELLVRKPEIVARSILAQSDADALLKKQIMVRSGVGVFRVGALETAVDCDYRSYVVEVIDVGPAQFLAGIEILPPRVGC